MDNLNLVVNIKLGFDEPTQKFLETLLRNVQVETMPKNNENDVPFEDSTEPKKDIAPKESEEPAVTLEMLRAELAAIMKKGGKDVVRQMLDLVSARKLSDVEPKNYKLLAELIKSWKIDGEIVFTE